MARARIDTSIKRQTFDLGASGSAGGPGGIFDYPLGVYPVEPLAPVEGFTLAFESADDGTPPGFGGPGPGGGAGGGGPAGGEGGAGSSGGVGGLGSGQRGSDGARRGTDDEDSWQESSADPFDDQDEGELEPWPDRYVFDINIRASRVESLCRQLFALLPGRVFPILDVMGNDAFREIDPFIAYELVGIERFLDAVRRFRGWFFEDGMVGFGAMSEEPFVYVFIDEHKIVTVRVTAQMKEQVERILTAFDLKEIDKIAGADAAVHEHRGVLDAPADRPDLLTHDEIVEQLRDDWGLTLNVDPFNNADDQGVPLGRVVWRCVVRSFNEQGEVRYVEVFLTAESLQTAGDLAISAAEALSEGADPLAAGDVPSWEEPDWQSGEDPTDLGKVGGKPVERTDSPAKGGSGRMPPKDTIPLDDLTMDLDEFDLLVADRLRSEDLDQVAQLKGKKPDFKTSSVLAVRWLE